MSTRVKILVWHQNRLQTLIIILSVGDAGGWCQQRFCECDRAAIDCMTRSSYNSTLRGLEPSSCSATNQTGNLITTPQWWTALGDTLYF